MASKKGNNRGSNGKGKKDILEATNTRIDHRIASNSPAGSTSSSVQTTVAKSSTRSVSAKSKGSSSDGPEQDRETTLAKIQARLQEMNLTQPKQHEETDHATSPVAAQPKASEGDLTMMVEGFLLVKELKPEQGAPAKKSEFKQGNKVMCSECRQLKDVWRNMLNVRFWQNEEESYWMRTCVECHMVNTGMTHGQAMADIKSRRPDNQNRKDRIAAYTHAMKVVQENFPMMDDKQELRTVTRMSFKTEVFASFAKLIERKVRHMETNKELWEEYEKLVGMMKGCKFAHETETLMKEIAELEQKMEETELPLAFQTKCVPGSEEHWRFMQAAQYSDEWVCNKNIKNEVTSAFRSFYICLSGGAEWPCYTVIPSKTWSTLHEDPLASKQRWYCICCGAKYMTRFGMIIELQIGSGFYYVKAEIPPDHTEDLRAMHLEETLKPKDPRDLFDKLKLVTPHQNEILRPIKQAEVKEEVTRTKFDISAYKILPEAYKQLPKFDWDQLMNFGSN